MVIYLNQMLGITDESVATALPKKCRDAMEEVMGVLQMVRKCILDYGSTGGNFMYDRAEHFRGLPSPAYIPAGDAAVGRRVER